MRSLCFLSQREGEIFMMEQGLRGFSLLVKMERGNERGGGKKKKAALGTEIGTYYSVYPLDGGSIKRPGEDLGLRIQTEPHATSCWVSVPRGSNPVTYTKHRRPCQICRL